jgi:hypothetical protein
MNLRDWWHRFVARHVIAPVAMDGTAEHDDIPVAQLGTPAAPLRVGGVIQRAKPAVPPAFGGEARCLDCADVIILYRPWIPTVSTNLPCRCCSGRRWHIRRDDGVEFYITGYEPSTMEHE